MSDFVYILIYLFIYFSKRNSNLFLLVAFPFSLYVPTAGYLKPYAKTQLLIIIFNKNIDLFEENTWNKKGKIISVGKMKL